MNQLTGNHLKHWCKLVDIMILRWLREMDGENTEEDRAIHTNYFKLDGQNINQRVKKVFESFFNSISYHR